MLAFTNKNEYVAWRNQWKADYAALSNTIRDIKFARWFEDSQRGGVKMSDAQIARYQAIAAAHKGKWGFFPNHTLAVLRKQATAMLADRVAAKVQAQEQYLKSLEVAVAK